MKLPSKLIPPDIFSLYNLEPIISNEHVFIKISKGVYGLKQAGILAFQALQDHLAHLDIDLSDTPLAYGGTSVNPSFSP